MINILTIDLEDYFMVSGFESVVRRQDWDKYESRIERNTYRLLEILGGSSPYPSSIRTRDGVKATFFCLGWVGERYPKLIRRIQQQGHEIACHGYDHRLVYSMTPDHFLEDVGRSKKILEDIIGEKIIGYRAPSYSITRKSLWALEILGEAGYHYDSSIFPIHHDRYGIPDAPRFPFTILCNGNGQTRFLPLSIDRGRERHEGDQGVVREYPPHSSGLSLVEFPLSTIRLFNMNLPVCGGGYFRLLPYGVIKKALRRIYREEKNPFIFYLHPWEMDSAQPRIKGAGPQTRLRHYLNLNKTEKRFKRLLSDFYFSSIRENLGTAYGHLKATLPGVDGIAGPRRR